MLKRLFFISFSMLVVHCIAQPLQDSMVSINRVQTTNMFGSKKALAQFQKTMDVANLKPVIDPALAVIYLVLNDNPKYIHAITNYNTSLSEKSYRQIVLSEIPNPLVFKPLFDGASTSVNLKTIPIYIDNKVFTSWINLKGIASFQHVNLVSRAASIFPMHHLLGELAPGIYATPDNNIEALHRLLFEQDFNPARATAISLINNESVNAVWKKALPGLEPMRTVTQLDRAIENSPHDLIFILGQIQGDSLIRYKFEGGISYIVPLRQFGTLSTILQKEIVVIGCNYADNPDFKPPIGPIVLSQELAVLDSALKYPNIGKWLQVLVNVGGDSILIKNENNFKDICIYHPFDTFKKPVYNLIFYRTMHRPGVIVYSLKWLLANAIYLGVIVGIFQAMCYFVLNEYAWAHKIRWLNWIVLFFLFSCYLWSPIMK